MTNNIKQLENELAKANAQITVLVEALKQISTDKYCEGPSCYSCDNLESHPPTGSAIVALQALSTFPAKAKAYLDIVEAARKAKKDWTEGGDENAFYYLLEAVESLEALEKGVG